MHLRIIVLKYSYNYPATAAGYAGFASGAVAGGGWSHLSLERQL